MLEAMRVESWTMRDGDGLDMVMGGGVGKIGVGFVEVDLILRSCSLSHGGLRRDEEKT